MNDEAPRKKYERWNKTPVSILKLWII
jgi:hypothetical protein